MTDWTAAHGAITAYDDIPAEMLVGLARGKLGDWLQEVHDAGWNIEIRASVGGGVKITQPAFTGYDGWDYATHRVDIMLTRAYIAWKGREG